MAAARRISPNILVCGTPGTGKSTLCEAIAAKCGLSYIDVGSVVRERMVGVGVVGGLLARAAAPQPVGARARLSWPSLRPSTHRVRLRSSPPPPSPALPPPLPRLPQVREKGFHAGRDEAFDAFVLDEASEDKLLDELEPTMTAGGVVLEFHSVDFFPERWFDLVLVLRTNNTVLFDRLTARCVGVARGGALVWGCGRAARVPRPLASRARRFSPLPRHHQTRAVPVVLFTGTRCGAPRGKRAPGCPRLTARAPPVVYMRCEGSHSTGPSTAPRAPLSPPGLGRARVPPVSPRYIPNRGCISPLNWALALGKNHSAGRPTTRAYRPSSTHCRTPTARANPPPTHAPQPLPLSSGYSAAKVEENVSAEIMCVVAEEARESYAEELVHQLASDSSGDLEANVERAVGWVEAYREGNKA